MFDIAEPENGGLGGPCSVKASIASILFPSFLKCLSRPR